MRAVVLRGVGEVAIEEVPDPAPKPGEVVVQVAHNGICGSDLGLIYSMGSMDFEHPLTGQLGPQILGHEFAGTIAALGDGVADWQVGDRVAARANYSCGSCSRCRAGATNLCEVIAFHGVMAPGGGLSPLTAVPASMLHRLPDEVSLEQGALVEPLAVALHAIRRVGVEPGQQAVVLGAGPVGIGVALNLRALGVEQVVLTETSDARREIAASLSLEVVDPATADPVALIKERTAGAGADAVFECAGVPATFAQALSLVRAQGEVSLVATYKEPITLDTISLMMSEARLSSALAYLPDDFETVIAGLARGDYPTQGWVEHIALDDVVAEGFEASRDGRRMKVLVDL